MAEFNLAEMMGNVPNRDISRQRLEYIPIDKLRPDPENFYSMNGVESLARNISDNGLLDPINVYIDKEFPDVFTILSGHRRHQALLILYAEEPKKWGEVRCIVDREDIPKAARKLRLMMANCDTRHMTSSDLIKQATEMEKCIEDLQAQGYEFHGRRSEYVAKALNTSKTKLAKLKVIREGLIPCWGELWEQGKANDEVCYKLAHHNTELQETLFARFGTDPSKLYAYRVDEYAQTIARIPTECKHGQLGCTNARSEKEKIVASADPSYCGCGRCCFGCRVLERCGHNCALSQGEKEKLWKKSKAEKQAQIDRQAAQDAPIIEATAGFIRRMVETATDKDIPDEAVVKALGKWGWDRDWSLIADGVKEVKANTDIPLGYGVTGSVLVKLKNLADLLGVSIDYLVTGKEPETKCPESGQGWKDTEPDKPGWYVAAYELVPGKMFYSRLYWTGSQFLMRETDPSSSIHASYLRYWIELPEVDNV